MRTKARPSNNVRIVRSSRTESACYYVLPQLPTDQAAYPVELLSATGLLITQTPANSTLYTTVKRTTGVGATTYYTQALSCT